MRKFNGLRMRRRRGDRFAERLDKFTRNVDDSHAGEVVTPSRMPFWALERSWDYTAPKSVVLIRRMLQADSALGAVGRELSDQLVTEVTSHVSSLSFAA